MWGAGASAPPSNGRELAAGLEQPAASTRGTRQAKAKTELRKEGFKVAPRLCQLPV